MRALITWMFVCQIVSLTGEISANPLSPTPDWIAETDGGYAPFATSAGDVNSDGFQDLLVGSWDGFAYVWLGGESGLGPSGSLANAYWSASCPNICDFGRRVASGDFNGDGYPDIAIGATSWENQGGASCNEGAVFVWYGGADGFGPNGTPANADWRAESNQCFDSAPMFGWSLAIADINGDGYGDLIVGHPRYNKGTTDEGSVFVWFGGVSGLGPLGTPANADWLAESNQYFSDFGHSVAGTDLNRDGYDDLVVAAPSFDIEAGNEGRVFAWYGSGSGLGSYGLPSNADWSARGAQSSDFFGISADAAGDVNGDGHGDVVIGAYNYGSGQDSRGQAYLYLGSPGGLAQTPAWTAEGDQADARFGSAVGSAGDVNADSYDDVIVGAFSYENGQTLEGRAYLYLGSASGLRQSPAWTAEGNQVAASFGKTVGSAGDVNGDGFDEAAIGVEYYDAGNGKTSVAMIYYGGDPGCFDTDGNGDVDNDDDGLCDSWEIEGGGIDWDSDGHIDLDLWEYDIDGDGRVAPSERPARDQKDLYVEVDWLDQHAPIERALDLVTQAFAGRGIRLHVQRDEPAHPHADVLYWDEFHPGDPAPGAADFDNIKSSRFGTHAERTHPANSANILASKRLVFHYALFVDLIQGVGSSGVGEGAPCRSVEDVYEFWSGNDFVVALGNWEVANVCVRCRDKQAATFMHELGHNLGLSHGGGDILNCEPNYLSVMNYIYQFDRVWFDPRPEPEFVSARPLDYSRGFHLTLQESMLREMNGIGHFRGERIAYGPQGSVQKNVDASGAIDWSQSDADGDGVSNNDDLGGQFIDLNDLMNECNSGPVAETLEDHDDWGNLKFAFRNSPLFANALSECCAGGVGCGARAPGVSGSGEVAQGLLDEELSFDAVLAAGMDSDVDGVPDVIDVCPEISDSSQQNADLDGSGDACDCDSADASVYLGASEINDGKDNNCPGDFGFALVDEVEFASLSDLSKIEFSWWKQEGATEYEVIRSDTPDFATCTLTSVTSNFWEDLEPPLAGGGFYYLVRTGAPHLGSFGKDSAGTERVGGCTP